MTRSQKFESSGRFFQGFVAFLEFWTVMTSFRTQHLRTGFFFVKNWRVDMLIRVTRVVERRPRLVLIWHWLLFSKYSPIIDLFLIIGSWIMPRLPWPNIMLRILKTKLQLNVYNYMEDGDLWWKPQLQGKLKMMFL